jgi:UDP-N-acetylmuramoyl-L-alanyl-D-glutamate--2,6-diaminopimelate ligase
MEAYGEAKLKLFISDNLDLSIVNLDDNFSNQILSSQTAKQCLTYSLSNPKADLYCHQIQAVSNGFQIELGGRWGKQMLVLPLLGDFNIANILAALLTLLGLGFDFDRLLKIAENICSVPGRMQLVFSVDTPLVIVDYAHTPDALENALQAIQQHIKGKLWCIFGCGGDRDIGKRPLMAEVAERLSDNVVVTSDNPRSEVPELIIEQICQGLSNKQVRVEVDRQKAILKTVLQATPEDVVLLAGKGHETYQEINGVRHAFDDVEQAELAQAAYINQSGVHGD